MKLDICLNKNKNKDFFSYDFIYFVWNQLLFFYGFKTFNHNVYYCFLYKLQFKKSIYINLD